MHVLLGVDERGRFSCCVWFVLLCETFRRFAPRRLTFAKIEGLLDEELTEAEIVREVDKNVCARLGGKVASLCDDVVQFGVPTLVKLLDQNAKVGDVCQKYGFCAAPDANVPDPHAVPNFVVNLDLPPAQRWLPVVQDPVIRAGILKYGPLSLFFFCFCFSNPRDFYNAGTESWG